ncbi:MAG TPA: acyltransferase [Solimonas sp.]|nr:acyltransferase [Solimonas sp.]
MSSEAAGPAGGAAPGAAIPSLDGIRAVAVSLVFFAHSGLEHVVPGALGVTIFFVLSGYLITTLMRTEYTSSGAVSFRSFYLRRVLRLMPPLLIVVAAAALLAALGVTQGSFAPLGLMSVLFYFGNYYVIANDFTGIVEGIGVVWSLAVEEHYYLFYPPLAALLLRSGRAGRSAGVLLALCVAVLAWRFVLALNGASEAHLTMSTDTRIDAILFGCVLALWRNPWLDRPLQASRAAEWGVMAACVAVLLATLLYRGELFRLTLRYTLQSMAIVPLLYLAVARADRLPFRWLNSRPMVYIGTVSYTVYLSHQVILFMVERHLPQLGWPGTIGLTALLTLAVCECMRRWVELPCARLRKRLHRDVLRHAGPAPAGDPQFLPGQAGAK